MVTHYSPANWGGIRGIAAYQVWNEANVVNFWTGTPLQMAQLTKAAWNTVKGVDKGALVLSPAYASRIAEQIKGIKRFAFAWVDGVPAWRYTDAISLNLYPLDKYGTALGTPEKSMALLAQARTLLGYGGVPASKPIWNTEINYGMRRRPGAAPISAAARRRPTCCAPTCSTRPTACSGWTGTPGTWATCPTGPRWATPG